MSGTASLTEHRKMTESLLHSTNDVVPEEYVARADSSGLKFERTTYCSVPNVLRIQYRYQLDKGELQRVSGPCPLSLEII